MAIHRAVKHCVQLITASNDCFLFSKQKLQKSINISFNLWELTKCPTKSVFIEKNGGIQSKLGFGRKQKLFYIQKATSIFINREGFCPGWEQAFPDRLYLQFINLERKRDLPKIPFFCVFPNYAESQKLQENYGKAGADDYEFPFAFYCDIPKELSEEAQKNQTIIQKANIDFIWEKRKQLKTFVKAYREKKLDYHRLLWLNEQLENVSHQLFDPRHFLWKKKEDDNKNIKKNDYETDEIIGMKNIKNLLILPSYRVYGHFAYCCLELYLDIIMERKLFVCENCGQYNYLTGHRDRERCNRKENEDCYRDILAKNRSAERASAVDN